MFDSVKSLERQQSAALDVFIKAQLQLQLVCDRIKGRQASNAKKAAKLEAEKAELARLERATNKKLENIEVVLGIHVE